MDASWVNAIGTWATAGGTIAVAIVAVFPIREWWRRPKLSLRCKADRPWLIDAPIVVGTEEDTRFKSRRLRVEIRNDGRSDATNIEVHADLLEVQGEDGAPWALICNRGVVFDH
ncbi:MAG: hypothetical protein FJ255_00280 [Phycisphaerae bacterium]|nr:hypothetical protein [Phycisphaerae bacterium]